MVLEFACPHAAALNTKAMAATFVNDFLNALAIPPL